MTTERPPRVVAELGRPETADEATARKEEARRLRRARQTFRNLVASLLVTVAVAAVIVLIAPHGAGTTASASVDYRQAAQQNEDTAGEPLLAPAVAAGWRANAAQLRRTGSVTSWYVGFVTAQNGFVAFNEGLDANAAWLAALLDSAPKGATTTIEGLPWRTYDRRDLGQAAGNVGYALVTRIGSTWIAVYGTAPVDAESALAASLADAAKQRGLTGTASAP